MKENKLAELALHYHRVPRPGKIEVRPTKPLATQMDLSYAYSPGVAAPCREIAANPEAVSLYTARANLVAVISNGTAVLGLGAIGPLAAKPVMEGKGVLFKKFANIDVFDIEINENDPDKLVEIVASLEPTFGGINLEDIKAPECFIVERALSQRMGIPVFHDDQHGTAIIVAAAVLNAMQITGKKIADVRLTGVGAGAAGLSCLDMLVSLGLRREHISLFDRDGLIHQQRDGLDPYKKLYARAEEGVSLEQALVDADIFLGLSGGGVLTPKMVEKMAPQPLILALANPDPEILPEAARAARPDAIMATGRSDYPNQVNNALCFPYIFRGALDVGAACINQEMKVACVHALAALAATAEAPDEESGATPRFGPDYLIPRPFDPRLAVELPLAVAKAAMESGVAARPIADLGGYRERLERFVYASTMIMKPVFEQARREPKRVAYADGEDRRVLRAVQVAIDGGVARPVLIGRRETILNQIEEIGLAMRLGDDFDLIDPRDHPFYEACWNDYHRLMERKGVQQLHARQRVRTRMGVLGAMLLRLGKVDALLCGLQGRAEKHLRNAEEIIGLQSGVRRPAAMNALISPADVLFVCDTFVNVNPDADEIAAATLLAAAAVRRFGTLPKVAVLSSSSFGARSEASAEKMRNALQKVREAAPDLEIEGEMQADLALSEPLRKRFFTHSRLEGRANLLIMPSLDAADIAYNLLKIQVEGVNIGPILMGMRKPIHILSPSATVRSILNMTALAAAEAGTSASAEA